MRFSASYSILKNYFIPREKRTIMTMTVRRLIRMLYKYYQDYVHAKLVFWWNAVKRAKTFWCAVISKHKSRHISLFLYNNIGNRGFQSTHRDRVIQQKLLINNRKKGSMERQRISEFQNKEQQNLPSWGWSRILIPHQPARNYCSHISIKLVHVYRHVKYKTLILIPCSKALHNAS